MKRHFFARFAYALAAAVALTCLLGAAPAQAQCLSEAECEALRNDIREYKESNRGAREEIRDLYRQAKELPRGSEERKDLRRQARELRRQLRQQGREEIRPLVERYRGGCKNC